MRNDAFDPALNLARRSLYRFAALTLVDPRAGSWEQLEALRTSQILADAGALIRECPVADTTKLGLGDRPLVDLDSQRVLQRLPKSPQALNEEFENTFGLLVSNACPPYETEYIPSKFSFQRSNTLADVSGFYRAFGLQPSHANPERPDHIVLELEFMASLLELERWADPHQRDICRDAQTRFLKEHLGWWVPAFANLLGKENAGGFYEAIGVFLAALIPAERTLLGVESAVRTVAPSTLERPEECEGCLLAGT